MDTIIDYWKQYVSQYIAVENNHIYHCEHVTLQFNKNCLFSVGIGGLQWKRHLNDKVAVTINDKDHEAVKEIMKNVEKNRFKSIFTKAGKTGALRKSVANPEGPGIHPLIWENWDLIFR